jgi:SAM-dependent methyltransferase
MTMMASQIDKCLTNPKWPEEWPFRPEDFSRQDESSDSIFYGTERLVHHIDDGARAALTKYYKSNIPEGSDVLDICSSWVSHYPSDLKLGKVAGLGMVAGELKVNPQLTEFTAKDLNKDPKLPYDENSFDVVTCVVSADYLNQPLQVFQEIQRVLRPGGKAIISQSNRCFPTKAINIWLNTNDLEHVFIIGCYFHYAGGFNPPVSKDISPGVFGDPMFIIEATTA